MGKGDRRFRVPGKVLVSLGGLGQETVEWLQDMCITRNEPMIEVDKSQEAAQLPPGCGLWELANSVNLILQGADTMLVHPVAQKVKLWDTQYTLVWVHHYTMCVQTPTDFAEVHQVLFLGGAGN